MAKRFIPTFDEARRLYPGTKRGCETEFTDFKRKHKDWEKVLPLLLPAIEKEIQYRKSIGNAWVEPWKHFKVWINQRCWEVERGAIDGVAYCLVCHSTEDCKHQQGQNGQKKHLCKECRTALFGKSWGDLPKHEIEQLVEQGKKLKANPPKPEAKSSDLVERDKVQAAVDKLTSSFGKAGE